MAQIIPSAIKDDTPGELDRARQYTTVRVASRRGIRTVKVRQDKLEKDYGKLDYQGETVYAKKVKVQSAKGVTRKAVSPKVLARQYTYMEKQRAYKKYDAGNIVEIQTTEGPRIVTEEQKKYLFKKEGRVYKKERTLYREKARKEKVGGGDKVPPFRQMVVTYDVYIPDTERTVTIDGHSRLHRESTEYEVLQEEAFYSMMKALKAEGHIADYNDQVEYEIANVAFVRFVS